MNILIDNNTIKNFNKKIKLYTYWNSIKYKFFKEYNVWEISIDFFRIYKNKNLDDIFFDRLYNLFFVYINFYINLSNIINTNNNIKKEEKNKIIHIINDTINFFLQIIILINYIILWKYRNEIEKINNFIQELKNNHPKINELYNETTKKYDKKIKNIYNWMRDY